jgi:cytochrome c553
MKRGEKILFIIFAVFMAMTVIGFGLLEYIRHHQTAPMYPISDHYDFSAAGLRGATLFREKGCTNCHRALRDGTNMGVVLDGLGSKYDFNYFYNFLKHPNDVLGQTVDHGDAPKTAAYVSDLPDPELRDLAHFLSQLRADPGAADSPIAPSEKSPAIEALLRRLAPEAWKTNASKAASPNTSP